jgi:hypothetical protein
MLRDSHRKWTAELTDEWAAELGTDADHAPAGWIQKVGLQIAQSMHHATAHLFILLSICTIDPHR